MKFYILIPLVTFYIEVWKMEGGFTWIFSCRIHGSKKLLFVCGSVWWMTCQILVIYYCEWEMIYHLLQYWSFKLGWQFLDGYNLQQLFFLFDWSAEKVVKFLSTQMINDSHQIVALCVLCYFVALVTIQSPTYK